jgi:hypothetical protein
MMPGRRPDLHDPLHDHVQPAAKIAGNDAQNRAAGDADERRAKPIAMDTGRRKCPRKNILPRLLVPKRCFELGDSVEDRRGLGSNGEIRGAAIAVKKARMTTMAPKRPSGRFSRA